MLSVQLINAVGFGWWTAGVCVCVCVYIYVCVCSMVVSSRCSSRNSARLPCQLESGWVGVGWHVIIEPRY